MDAATIAARKFMQRQRDCLASIRSRYPGRLGDYVARDYAIACAHYMDGEPITYITSLGDEFPAEEYFDLTVSALNEFKEATQ